MRYFLLLSLTGCVVAPPVSPTFNVPANTASLCASHCTSLGMDLGGVILVRNSAGCVCNPRAAVSRAGGPSAAAAGVVIVDEEEQQQQEQDRQRRNRSNSHSTPSYTKPPGSPP